MSYSLDAERLAINKLAPVRPAAGDGYDLTHGAAGILRVVR